MQNVHKKSVNDMHVTGFLNGNNLSGMLIDLCDFVSNWNAFKEIFYDLQRISKS